MRKNDNINMCSIMYPRKLYDISPWEQRDDFRWDIASIKNMQRINILWFSSFHSFILNLKIPHVPYLFCLKVWLDAAPSKKWLLRENSCMTVIYCQLILTVCLLGGFVTWIWMLRDRVVASGCQVCEASPIMLFFRLCIEIRYLCRLAVLLASWNAIGL